MNTYEILNRNNFSKNRIDRSKRNILLLGKASTSNKQKLILNPMNPSVAKNIYGDSDLYKAYKSAYDITKDSNIYTINCQLYTDYIELIDSIIHYNFDFIVPINLYLRDSFMNPKINSNQYFAAYYLDRLGYTDNTSTIIMTDYASNLYDSIDDYINDMNKIYYDFSNNSNASLSRYGNNLVFVLNNLIDNEWANVLLAATLSICDFTSYPEPISNATYFDIDAFDLNYKEMCFYKYHEILKQSTIESLYNFKIEDKLEKKILIDLLIKYVVGKLDMSKFSGTLYTPYTKLQINNKVVKIMEEMNGKVFYKYKINKIFFNKLGPTHGDIIIDITIVPFGLLENINIFIEV